MATTSRVQLDLPSDLFMRVQDAAGRSGQPVETVLVESLDLLFGTSSVDWEHLAATSEVVSDAQLWGLASQRMAWSEGARLRELTARGKQGSLTDDEHAELAELIASADRLTLLRSRALLILQKRGHDVREQLRLGA